MMADEFATYEDWLASLPGCIVCGCVDPMSDQPEATRYWLDDERGYVALAEFPPLLLAVREAEGAAGWECRHPREPTIDERARVIVERRTGRPAYLSDDEEWDAAVAEARAALDRHEPEER